MLCQHFVEIAQRALFAVSKPQRFLVEVRGIEPLVHDGVLRSNEKRAEAPPREKLHVPCRVLTTIFQAGLYFPKKQIFQGDFHHEILKLDNIDRLIMIPSTFSRVQRNRFFHG